MEQRKKYFKKLIQNKIDLMEYQRLVNMDKFGNYDWLPGYYKDQDVYVIGSGPSLIGFPFEVLKGKNKIIISHVAKFCKPEQQDILHFLDAGPRRKLAELFNFETENFYTVVGCNAGLQPAGKVAVIPYSKHLHTEPSRGFWGHNSTGHFGISIALCAGARHIYLLGHDCSNPTPIKNGMNFYDTLKIKGYKNGNPKTYGGMAVGYNKFEPVKDRITNLSLTSLVDTFNKDSWENHFGIKKDMKSWKEKNEI